MGFGLHSGSYFSALVRFGFVVLVFFLFLIHVSD